MDCNGLVTVMTLILERRVHLQQDNELLRRKTSLPKTQLTQMSVTELIGKKKITIKNEESAAEQKTLDSARNRKWVF